MHSGSKAQGLQVDVKGGCWTDDTLSMLYRDATWLFYWLSTDRI